MKLTKMLLLILGASASLGALQASASFQDQLMAARRARVQVECTSSGCPEGVGMLLRLDDRHESEAPKQCTAVLISPQLMLTNRHCLADGAEQGSNCAGTIQLLLPGVGAVPSERLGCRRVLATSEFKGRSLHDRLREPDWAVLELDRSSVHKPLEISLGGLPNTAVMRVVSADPSDRRGSLDSVVRTQECRVAQGHPIVPKFDGPERPVGVLLGCSFRPGHSGSAVLDSEGRLAALVHGHVRTESGKDIGLATNLSSLNLPR